MRIIYGLLLLLLLLAVSPPLSAQPSSQPAAGVGAVILAWLDVNWPYVVFTVLLPSVIVGLRAKSAREGVIGFLEALLERCSFTTPKDSPGTFKMIGRRAKPPEKR